jgi:SAM-dependent methyltransferase
MASHSSTGAVQRQFGAVAAAYAVSAVHASGPELAELLDAADLHEGARVLDLGCGAGHTAFALAARVQPVHAVDVTPEMLGVASDLARQRGISAVRFTRADAARLPFPHSSLDVVASRYAAHHFADPAAVLGEVVRVLAPGGRFLLVDTVAPEDAALDTFFNTVELLRDDSHVRNWRGSEWVRMLAQAGLDARVVNRYALALDGAAWVGRSQTPAPKVAIIRELLAAASPARRAALDIREDPWGLSVPVALIAGRKRG